MGVDLLNASMRIDGDLGTFEYQSTGTYIGGQPMGIGASGIVFGDDVNDAEYAGIFYNSSIEDTNIGSENHGSTTDLSVAKPSVVWRGGAKVKLYMKSRHDYSDATAPFATGVTWALYEPMYIANTGGLWTNVTSTNNTTIWGHCLLAPAAATDPLIAILY